MRQFVALAALAATLLMAHPCRGAPAMWVIRHRDCTVYLLGTIHATKWRTPPWFTGRLARAFSASQELWLETTDESDPGGPGLTVVRPPGGRGPTGPEGSARA